MDLVDDKTLTFGRMLDNFYWDEMLFTGYKDIHGREIYAGDILDIWEDYDYQKNLLVRWCEKSCAFVMDNWTTRSFGFISTEKPVVIWNKFENPELLTQSL